MSTFKVEVVEIAEVINHPNADKLDILKLVGMDYQVISVKDNFKVGDLAFYFPIESVIPDEWITKFEINNYYDKKIRAIKLRGIFSEGLLIAVNKIDNSAKLGDDYTEYFGVTKYEYKIPDNLKSKFSGNILTPIGMYKFPAPEHYKRYSDVLIDGEEIVITEKIHGTNFSVLINEDEIRIASHNVFLTNDEANKDVVYIRAYNEFIKDKNLPINTQIYGEIYGVQDIKYGKKNGDIGLALFAVKRNGRFINYYDFIDFCTNYNLTIVPLLYIGEYDKSLLSKYNNADSVLSSDCLMEGIIIQPVKERSDIKMNRVCLKLISDRYLLRKNPSELH